MNGADLWLPRARALLLRTIQWQLVPRSAVRAEIALSHSRRSSSGRYWTRHRGERRIYLGVTSRCSTVDDAQAASRQSVPREALSGSDRMRHQGVWLRTLLATCKYTACEKGPRQLSPRGTAVGPDEPRGTYGTQYAPFPDHQASGYRRG